MRTNPRLVWQCVRSCLITKVSDMCVPNPCFFTLLALLPLTHAFNHLIPDNKELIYKWKANVRAGTYASPNHETQFVLQGKIYMQRYNSSVFVRIANLTYKIYNGEVSDEVEMREVHIPEEVQELENVYEIVYNDDGLVDEIVTQSDEKEFSRNIKRAIAGILQVEETVTSKEYSRPVTFTSGENSIYGYGNVYYSIYPRKGGIEVDKVYDMSEYPSSKNIITNADCECDNSDAEIETHGRKKRYFIVKLGDYLMTRHISTTGAIVYYPFTTHSDAQYVEVNQTFTLGDVTHINEEYHLEGETLSTDLTYNPYIKWQNRRDYDFTNGRHTTNYDKLIPVIKKILEEIPHATSQDLGSKNGQLVNRVQNLLLQFHPEGLQLLMKSLDAETLKTFYHILPLVDTDAAKLLIKDIVINKIVTDATAVSLLQNMADTVRPASDLLPELEELIHLNDAYSWEVRKVAILRFGTLIHKSYTYSKEMKDDNSEEPYERYITEYVNRLMRSKSYKTQQIYLLGLRNMKLPSIIKHLRQAFNGEWWNDQHLRFLSLWAAASSDSDDLFQTLWPIFTNKEELVEMRLLAYLHIMKTRPSDSVLKLISNYMLSEQDEDVYHFHYTYLETMMGSKEPCLEDMRTKLAKVMKITPPPKYGLSTAKIFGFSDKMGYGNGFESYFFKTKRSRIYQASVKSRQFGKYQEEYAVYLKIHDNENKHLFPTKTILDTLYYFFTNRFTKWTNDGNYIEGAVLRRGQIINAYFFDGNNANIAQQILRNLVFEPVRSMELTHVNYHNYHKTLIPTDLGLPVSWEILKPAFYQNTLNFTVKYKKDFSFEFLIKNKFNAMLHYRHGLSFYNPITDMWQGINRYHYFNAMVPLQVKLSYSSFMNTVTFLWVKSDGAPGVRSDAKQMVFVRDEFNREQFQKLTLGRKFSQYQTYIDKEALNTGLKLYVGISDSRRIIPTNSLITHLHTLALKDNYHFGSTLEQLILAGANLLSYTILLPEPETNGVFAKLEFSPKFSVTNTKLIMKYKLDFDKTVPYVPEYHGNLFLWYSVRNKSENLLTWVTNTSMEVGRGHSYGTFRTEVTRVVPGERSYKICANATERFLSDKVYGHLHVSMGNVKKERCSNESTVDIFEIGSRSFEEDDMSDTYGNCQNSWRNYHSMQCLIRQNTIGYYRYEIKTVNLPKFVNNLVSTLWDHFKSYYQTHYTSTDFGDIGGDLTADITFPVESPDEVDIEVRTPQKLHQLTAIPNTYWRFYGLFPKMTSYSILFLLFEKSGVSDRLEIHPDRYYFNNDVMKQTVPHKWTPYLKSATKTDVYVKLVKNSTLAVKVNSNNHTFKILPRNGGYQVSRNGKLLALEEQHQEDWLYYHIFKDEPGQTLVVFLPISGIHLEYFMNRVKFTVPDGSQYISLS